MAEISLSITATELNSEIATKFSAFVQGKSKVSIVIQTSALDFKSYNVSFDGSTYWKYAKFGKILYPPITLEHEKIINSGTIPIEARITITGNAVIRNTLNVNVLPYFSPKITKLNCYRCNVDGSENPEGTRIKIKYAYEIAALNNLNDKACKFYYKEINSETWKTGGTLTANYSVENGVFVSDPIFDVEKTYNVKLAVEDFFESTELETVVSQAFTILDFNGSGKGVAIGKVSEIPDAFEVGIETKLVGGILYPVLQNATDLNSLTVPNKYFMIADNSYGNYPFIGDAVECMLTIEGQKNELLVQTLSPLSKAKINSIYKRIYNSDGWGEWINVNIFDLVYPVGSIYLSVNETNPGTLFGGTWEQIEDKFLLASGSNYSVGSTGGAASASISIEAHKHTIETQNNVKFVSGAVTSGDYDIPIVGTTNDAGSTTKTVSTMPPYLAVCVWKRTA